MRTDIIQDTSDKDDEQPIYAMTCTRDGVLHRHPHNGPARILRQGHFKLTEYRWHGRYHREDGPAVRIEMNDVPVLDAYYFLGLRHRRSAQGPAFIEYVDGRVAREVYYFGDELYRHPSSEPCDILRDARGEICEAKYAKKRKIRELQSRVRDTGSQIGTPWRPDPETVEGWSCPYIFPLDDCKYELTFRRNGVWHRDAKDGPAHISRTSKAISVSYCWNGYGHRDDGPASLRWHAEFSFKEGYVLNYHETYCWHGMPHRHPDVGPAYRRYQGGRIASEHYQFAGKHYRDPAVGPAMLWYNPEGKVSNKQYARWYDFDKLQQSLEERARELNVPLPEGPLSADRGAYLDQPKPGKGGIHSVAAPRPK